MQLPVQLANVLLLSLHKLLQLVQFIHPLLQIFIFQIAYIARAIYIMPSNSKIFNSKSSFSALSLVIAACSLWRSF